MFSAFTVFWTAVAYELIDDHGLSQSQIGIFAVFGAFIAYQLYRYSYTHEIALILLTVFDLFVIALAWHEYRLLRKHLPTH